MEKWSRTDVMIPSMIIQPFIENSIEHGFVGIDYPGEIRVDFKQQDKNITIEISDNGKGFYQPIKYEMNILAVPARLLKTEYIC